MLSSLQNATFTTKAVTDPQKHEKLPHLAERRLGALHGGGDT